jgi:O-methyltransferase
LQRLHRLAMACYHIHGDVLEVGVYRGGSLGMLAETLPHKTVWGCDTFSGIPCQGKHDLNKVGRFACSAEQVRKHVPLRNAILCRGVFPEVSPPIQRLAFAHLDCDQEQSYRDALPWIAERMQPGGMLVMDDYPHGSCLGAKRAVDEWNDGRLTISKTRQQAWIRWPRYTTDKSK